MLWSRYYDLTGEKTRIIENLNKAYKLNKETANNMDPKITKSILVSLINVNSHFGNMDNARKYLNELEETKNLTQEEKLVVEEIKQKLKV